ncbi:oligopeptide transport system ATP-binding protein [Hasllibacter halocynthiae]|uniref:Oligopeptide transport system ATP-binding protein n=1 Tax=Hasllibacter halocynthiae TaxID=595589 RepID=A0A2T0X299_9RHOB|nr:oligopeptide/dipeptide ABC transporter ATP-binding protein [Hasllibacter halocynthiae]PRY93076.1 oligopeptide transport system ATP-binding protein [Hasllibacter halocynthiae]
MTLLRLEDLSVTFPVARRGAWPWEAPDLLRAVTDVSLEVAAGETLGLVGESGSGKSTLARAVIGTIPASSGRVLWEGQDLAALSAGRRRRHRAEVQMVFQDPLAALNPRMTVGRAIAEPLQTHEPDASRDERRRRVGEVMEKVGLSPKLMDRYPHEFSGGQCQRVGIARALVLNPRLIVADEPVSALDVSVQAQVVNLMKRLVKDMGISLIFIAHDLSVVRNVSDRIAVMYLGRLMEVGPARPLIAAPAHPYTRALVEAVPVPDPARGAVRAAGLVEGDIPSPLSPPSGCVFRTRCPRARPDCADAPPALRPVRETEAACIHPIAEAAHA